MHRRIALTIALAVSVLSLALVSSDSTARAQQRQRCTADTGVVTLGPNQVLRVTAAAAWDINNDGAYDFAKARVGFSRIEYVRGGCNGGVCKHIQASPNPAGEPQELKLRPGEAASMDITPTPGSSGVRAVVLSNRRNVRVTAALIDAATGQPTTTSILETMEDDECGL